VEKNKLHGRDKKNSSLLIIQDWMETRVELTKGRGIKRGWTKKEKKKKKKKGWGKNIKRRRKGWEKVWGVAVEILKTGENTKRVRHNGGKKLRDSTR